MEGDLLYSSQDESGFAREEWWPVNTNLGDRNLRNYLNSCEILIAILSKLVLTEQ